MQVKKLPQTRYVSSEATPSCPDLVHGLVQSKLLVHDVHEVVAMETVSLPSMLTNMTSRLDTRYNCHKEFIIKVFATLGGRQKPVNLHVNTLYSFGNLTTKSINLVLLLQCSYGNHGATPTTPSAPTHHPIAGPHPQHPVHPHSTQ